VLVLPAVGKSMDMFQVEEGESRSYARQQLGGASEQGASTRLLQVQYDRAYVQCMYAKGNVVPGVAVTPGPSVAPRLQGHRHRARRSAKSGQGPPPRRPRWPGSMGRRSGDGPCVSRRHASVRSVESHGARDGKDTRPDNPRTRQHRCCRRQHACALRQIPAAAA